MIVSDRNTTPEQRFFFPPNFNGDYQPIECHSSFAVPNIPDVLVMPGGIDLAVIESRGNINGEANWQQDTIRSVNALRSGMRVREIVTRRNRTDEHMTEATAIQEAVETYTVADEDLLIVEPGFDPKHMIPRERRIVRANEALPLQRSKSNKVEKVKYRLAGIINKDTLITWEAGSPSAAWLADLAIANANISNRLELEVFKLDMGGRSLLDTMAISPTFGKYLRYMDAQHKTRMMPSKELWHRHWEYPEMTPEQNERYQFIRGVVHEMLETEEFIPERVDTFDVGGMFYPLAELPERVKQKIERNNRRPAPAVSSAI